MLCQNCGKNEANVKYAQIINGLKKEMILCEECSKKIGIGDFKFNIPIDISSFLSEFLEDSENEFLPSFTKTKNPICKKCGMSFDDFINDGKLGCSDCYETFSERIDPILKKIHVANRHVGRKVKNPKFEIESKENYKKENEPNKQDKKEKNDLEKLKKELKEAIKNERYEDAAKIRDQIKIIEEN